MKKGLKTQTLILFRKLGLLCRKPAPFKPQIRIQKSIAPDGTPIDHEDLAFAKNSLMGINIMGKDKKVCHYDYRTHSCRCGVTIQSLKEGENCPLKK